LRTIEVASTEWFAYAIPLPGGNVSALFAAPGHVVVDAATDLVRAFLVAILAAALLAVIAALWLSSRITRPMLELADDAERVKSDFLASVSHELRTPLTPIRGYTELLRRGVPARSRTGYLDEIGNATQRLERIVSLLVDVAAMDAGRYRIAEEDVGVRDVFGSVKERWSDRKSRIEVRLPKGELQVRADAAAISRVLDELIDNAFKFHPEGVVELRARRVRDRVELAVADRGPGIDPERLAALRTPFATGERGGDTKRYGGLGLGLSFVEGVLRAHGTQLSIATGPGEGTTCVFSLPAAGSVTAMPARTGRSGEQARRDGPSTRKPASRKR
jgi:signal transduction histidine kinase